MILGFKQQFPWKEPTYFREKILAGAGYGPIVSMPMIHTMREDPTNRWKPGRKIDMVYRGAGYKIIAHWNPKIPCLQKCVSVQKIEIKWVPLGGVIVPPPVTELRIFVDGRRLIGEELNKIAINDGFDNIHHFARWFKKDFSGKIIHWTNLRY